MSSFGKFSLPPVSLKPSTVISRPRTITCSSLTTRTQRLRRCWRSAISANVPLKVNSSGTFSRLGLPPAEAPVAPGDPACEPDDALVAVLEAADPEEPELPDAPPDDEAPPDEDDPEALEPAL